MSKTINQDTFVRLLAKKTDIQKKDCDFVWQSALDIIADLLKEDSIISFKNFGKFKLRKIEEHEGMNPRTKEKMIIPTAYTPVFKCAENLKKTVNGISDT